MKKTEKTASYVSGRVKYAAVPVAAPLRLSPINESFVEEQAIEDGARRVWDPPSSDPGLVGIYRGCWWLAFMLDVAEEEFPNG